ncbi:MAG: GDSL-type esterase/lipase family protein [bacterium]|jgi:acyl-CoA thioesterase-1
MTADIIVALGDSLTYGYPFGPASSWVEEAATILKRPIVNRGINGETSFDLLSRVEEDALSLKPSCVVILIGSNDALFAGMRWSETEANLRALAEAVQGSGAQVVFGLPPAVDDPAAERRLQRQRAWLQDEAPRQHWELIDFYTPLVDPTTGEIREELTVDGLHPSKEGYRLMGQAAAGVLRRLGYGNQRS